MERNQGWGLLLALLIGWLLLPQACSRSRTFDGDIPQIDVDDTSR